MITAPDQPTLQLWIETAQAMYLEELGREVDPSGLANWLDRASQGQHAEEIRAWMRTTDEWHALHDPKPAPPFTPAPREYRGNMCGVRVPGLAPVAGGAADPALVLSWFYDRYSPDDRAKIRAAWQAKSFLDVLVSWPDSRAFGQSPAQFVATCAELVAAGFRPCVFLYSKDFDPSDAPGILAAIAPVLPALLEAHVAPRVCIGWELSIALSPTTVQTLIDAIAPPCVAAGVKVYVHFQEGYAAFQQPGGVTADFWRLQVGKLTGLLHQRDLSWDQPMYQARLVDILERFAGGYGFPSDSGFGHPFDCIALEITAQPQFNGQMSEALGDEWARVARATTPVNGVGVIGTGN